MTHHRLLLLLLQFFFKSFILSLRSSAVIWGLDLHDVPQLYPYKIDQNKKKISPHKHKLLKSSGDGDFLPLKLIELYLQYFIPQE